MNLKREFEKLIEKKRAEIAEAEKAVAAAEAYIQAMTDALKKLPKDDSTPALRAGSEVEKIREAIVGAGRPLHLNEIIEALGRGDDGDAKAKVAGILGWYTTREKVFTKVAPNTYGLIERRPPDLPSDFGEGDAPEQF